MKQINILNYIVCPNCRESDFLEKKTQIKCKKCKVVYPIRDGILILVYKQMKKILKIWDKAEEYNEYEFFTTPVVANQVGLVTNERTLSLDVGCGAGAYQKDFKGAVISFDIIPYFVRRSNDRFSSKNRVFLVADANEFPFKKDVFDLVFSSQVIEHFDEKSSNKLLNNMKNSTTKIVMVDTPNDGNVFIHGLRDLIYGKPSEHEDYHLDHHRLVGRSDLEKLGFKTHSCIGYVSRHRFKFGILWEIYDFIAWRFAGFGGNLIGIYKKSS